MVRLNCSKALMISNKSVILQKIYMYVDKSSFHWERERKREKERGERERREREGEREGDGSLRETENGKVFKLINNTKVWPHRKTSQITKWVTDRQTERQTISLLTLQRNFSLSCKVTDRKIDRQTDRW